MDSQTTERYQFAIDLAQEAGDLALKQFGRMHELSFKSDGSPVSKTDFDIENLLRTEISKKFPGDSFLGEEFGGEEGDVRWILDPIDGTFAYVRGIPFFATLLALEVSGQIKFGIANFPALKEFIYAAIGEGSWWNGTRCFVSQVEQPTKAIAIYSLSEDYILNSPFRRKWQTISQDFGYKLGMDGNYGACLLATGRAELLAFYGSGLWDIAPFFPIIQEAGGFVGTWGGKPVPEIPHAVMMSDIVFAKYSGILSDE